MENKFEIDIKGIRDDARAPMEKGPVTGTYGADRARLTAIASNSFGFGGHNDVLILRTD